MLNRLQIDRMRLVAIAQAARMRKDFDAMYAGEPEEVEVPAELLEQLAEQPNGEDQEDQTY